jgi:hypothetical protein
VTGSVVVSVLALGALHGINPGMGWLFAVSLGLQEGSGRAVWRALPPLALGHALAVAVALLAAAAIGVVLPLAAVRWIAAGALTGAGLFHLRRHRHPVRGGMRVDWKDLTAWSFLMASAHGAGLMVVPFVLPDAPFDGHGSHAHAETATHLHNGWDWAAADPALLAAALHTAGYLVVAGAIAWVVYVKLGVRLLRTAWLNIDLFWAVALVATGLLTLLA